MNCFKRSSSRWRLDFGALDAGVFVALCVAFSLASFILRSSLILLSASVIAGFAASAGGLAGCTVGGGPFVAGGGELGCGDEPRTVAAGSLVLPVNLRSISNARAFGSEFVDAVGIVDRG